VPAVVTGRDQLGDLVEAARQGDRAALARLMSIVERGGDDGATVSRLTHPLGGGAYTVGITGAPGAGKSTLTNRLCSLMRAGGDPVAVLAIDPSSPFSGGAILGDRVRMGDQAGDPGVYIRSMATRGHLGGLTLATPAAVRVLDAVGMSWVVIETVGVGQVEVSVAGAADTTVVVVNPGWGDAVQANKAGLMEIADVFVINKADRRGGAETAADLESMLSLRGEQDWTPPIVLTTATSGDGLPELFAAITGHRRWVESSGRLAERRERRTRDEVRSLVSAELTRRVADVTAGERFDAAVASVAAHRTDPLSAARDLVDGSAMMRPDD
jgi:LAO/AO transport system kinase